jgi:hypothetical protein
MPVGSRGELLRSASRRVHGFLGIAICPGCCRREFRLSRAGSKICIVQLDNSRPLNTPSKLFHYAGFAASQRSHVLHLFERGQFFRNYHVNIVAARIADDLRIASTHTSIGSRSVTSAGSCFTERQRQSLEPTQPQVFPPYQLLRLKPQVR